jgi:hypothetical protein
LRTQAEKCLLANTAWNLALVQKRLARLLLLQRRLKA